MDDTTELALRTRAHREATQLLEPVFEWLGEDDAELLARLKDAMVQAWSLEVEQACSEAARKASERAAQDKLDELAKRVRRREN